MHTTIWMAVCSLLTLSACQHLTTAHLVSQHSTAAQIAANNARHAGHDHTQADASAYRPLGDTAETSLDWAGLYVGNIPCPDCDHIRISLQLRPDKTYALQEQHFHNQRLQHEHLSSGRFEFDRRHTSLIRLHDRAAPRQFFIGEGYAEARHHQTGKALSPASDYRIEQIKTY